MTTRRPSNEDRLAAIDARLPKPPLEETPGLEWLGFLSFHELLILEHVARDMGDRPFPADLADLQADVGPLAAGIITLALGRMASGWPREESDPDRYRQSDDALDMKRQADELCFGVRPRG